MANEIKAAVSITFIKSGTTDRVQKEVKGSFDVSGDSFIHQTLVIGTSEEEVQFGADIGSSGWCFLKNHDATNYIRVGAITGQYSIKLKPGEFALFRLNPLSLYAIADTASCSMEFIVVED